MKNKIFSHLGTLDGARAQFSPAAALSGRCLDHALALRTPWRRRLGAAPLLPLALVALPSLALAQNWLLNGNAITPGQFLGTTDTNALELKINNSRALRLEPGSSPNLIGGYSGNFVLPGVAGATISGGGQSGQT